MGGVKDNIIFRDCAGGKYVGQYACRLNHLYQTFAVSPAYFGYSEYDKFGQIRMKRKVESQIEDRVIF